MNGIIGMISLAERAGCARRRGDAVSEQGGRGVRSSARAHQ
ncbi:MAG: hypothetical protein ACLR4Z_01040 [Butyricicoccaceae bacterium]